jgi:hypothetical protein
VTGAAAITALGVGTAYGLVARSRNSDSHSHCRTETLCDRTGVALRDDALFAGNVSTASFVIGLTAAGASVVLWWLGGRRATRAQTGARFVLTPQVARDFGGIAVDLSL